MPLGTLASERLKDLATIQGVRSNQLVGYAVVGLDGTGDQTTQTPFTTQSINNMLAQLGTTLPTTQSLQLKNVAAVMVTANPPPFARVGQQIDITVSSMGNAKSLRGGTLVMTPLKAADGQIYAQAQGNLMVGGAGAARLLVGVGRWSIICLPGALWQEPLLNVKCQPRWGRGRSVHFEMLTTDFGTTQRAVEAINREMGQGPPKRSMGELSACRRLKIRTTAWHSWAPGESRSTPDEDDGQGGCQSAYRVRGHEPDGDYRTLRRRARCAFRRR